MKVEPCPTCGGQPSTISTSSFKKFHVTGCLECSVVKPNGQMGSTKTESKKAWNAWVKSLSGKYRVTQMVTLAQLKRIAAGWSKMWNINCPIPKKGKPVDLTFPEGADARELRVERTDRKSTSGRVLYSIAHPIGANK